MRYRNKLLLLLLITLVYNDRIVWLTVAVSLMSSKSIHPFNRFLNDSLMIYQ